MPAANFLADFYRPDVKTISTLLKGALRADFALPFPENEV